MHQHLRHRGFTLAEVLATCAVVAIAAAVALPSAQPVAEFRLDAAAGEVAQALRFAREEAMRTRSYRMLRCDTARNTLSVFIPTANGAVAAPVKHPLDKTDYTIALGQAPSGAAVALASCSFVYADKTTAAMLSFDADGMAVLGTGDAKSAAKSLSSGTFKLVTGTITRAVAVDGAGRVTIS